MSPRKKLSLWERYQDHLENAGLTQRRISKLQVMYTMCESGLSVPLDQAERSHLEDFVRRLHRNEFRQNNGKPYSGSSKSDMKKFLKQFYKWLEGKGEDYPDKVRWIRTAIAKDEKPKEKEIITPSEALKVREAAHTDELKAFVVLLYDSGFRIGEMLSVRKKDLKQARVENGSSEMCWWIECHESKTYPRCIPIPMFTDEINEFVRSPYYQGLADEELIFPKSDTNYRIGVYRASDRALGKRLTPHAFRHSSATHYADVLNGNTLQLATRYGWSFDASELKTYVRRSKLNTSAAAVAVVNDEVLKLKRENQEIRSELDALRETVTLLLNRA